MMPRGRLVVQLHQSEVHLSIRLPDRYAAMELYDQVIASARDGTLRLDMELINSREADA